MMMSNEVDHTKVPIWVGKDCKLVSGINKSTTCQNVIQSLIISDNPSKFVIVEKWKKMERRLDGSVRILKVWKAWGDQKDDVALILRPHHANDGYIDKRISNKVPRRNKSSQLHKLTNHDENMEEIEGGGREPMERLLKLVLTQGETIQAQLKKLRHQEDQIERYEEEMHRIRSLKEGDNYVVESYLRDDKGKKLRKRDKSPRKSGWLKHHHHHHHHANGNRSSHNVSKENDGHNSDPNPKTVQGQLRGTGGDNENKCDAVEDENYIHEQNELMERICELNSKLTKEEETLVKLGLKIKKYYERHKDNGQEGGSETVHDEATNHDDGDGDGDYKINRKLNTNSQDEELLRQLIGQVELLRDNTSEQYTEILMNEKSLNELEQLLDSKHDHVAHLTYQIQQVDEESEYLRQRLLKISHHIPHHKHPPPQSYAHYPSSSILSNVQISPIKNVQQQQQQQPLQQQGVGGGSHQGQPQGVPIVTCPKLSLEESQSSHVVVEKSSPQIMSTREEIPCDSSNVPITSINFPCSDSSLSIGGGTALNLHIKPCRDHQDNDSNSDTGISSLHSSSDENTLFVLDTLV